MKLFAFALLLFCSTFSNAQNFHGNNWLFGYKCGLDFATGEPQSVSESQMLSTEGCATISGKDGSLICYTNGTVVWNKLHQVMDGGTGLAGGNPAPWGGSSSTNGMLILPSITDSNQYLIFTQNVWLDTGIRVSTVDATYNGGLGKVVSKNEPVYEGVYFTEKFAACRHANGRDWWLVCLEMGFSNPTNRYHVLLYSPEGIQFHHVDTAGLPMKSAGQMIFSKYGNYLGVVGLGRVEVLDFDRCSGALNVNTSYTYVEDVFFNSNDYYSACFSPDESKFYVAAIGDQSLLQYSTDSINQTFTFIDTAWIGDLIDTVLFGPCDRVVLGQMQLGPNDKIYCSFSPVCTTSTPWSTYAHNLSVINNPNATAIACDFQPASVFVGNAPHYLLLGLPNMPNYNLGALVGSPCDTLTVSASSQTNDIAWSIYPNPFSNQLTVQLSGVSTKALIEVHDVLGQNVYRQELSPVNQSFHQAVDLSQFPSGMYTVRITAHNKNIVQKAVKH